MFAFGAPSVMGVYPMLLDETCFFLAVDLDGEARMDEGRDRVVGVQFVAPDLDDESKPWALTPSRRQARESVPGPLSMNRVEPRRARRTRRNTDPLAFVIFVIFVVDPRVVHGPNACPNFGKPSSP